MNYLNYDERHEIIQEDIINKVKKDAKELFKIYDKFGLIKSKKQLSEDISGLFETAICFFLNDAIAPKKDSEPDIIYNGKAIEIKTSSGTDWRGGEYSKRSGYFIFISWRLNENSLFSESFIEFYIVGINLKEEDLKKSKSENYYATNYGKKELYLNENQVTPYVGWLQASHGKRLTIKVNYE